MYDEDNLLPVSALQHLMFCERQCALIHIEQVWRDNPLTIEGSHMHERVDETGPRREIRGDVLIVRGVALRSFRLGLSGRADVVEFHRTGEKRESRREDLSTAVALSGVTGSWVPFPVDYKHGKPKRDPCDEIQLCAQASCLEEMLGVEVPDGALFYGKIKRRQNVVLHAELRRATAAAASRLHALIGFGVTPKAVKEPKCDQCSLLPRCLPEAMSDSRSATQYLQDALRDVRR
jgi:CRISPR-associated exonuclease Cas4